MLNSTQTMIRWNALKKLIPVSRCTIWRWEKEEKFPKRKKIGPNTVVWNLQEIEKWMTQ